MKCVAATTVLYEWAVTGWSSCSARCGLEAAGERTRTVSCKAFAEGKPPVDIDINMCDSSRGARPASNDGCNRFACRQKSARVTLDLDSVNFKQVTQSYTHRRHFESSFRTSLSHALGVRTYR